MKVLVVKYLTKVRTEVFARMNLGTWIEYDETTGYYCIYRNLKVD